MKLATLRDGTPDGELVVISRDLCRAISCRPVARTLQEALERWSEVAAPLELLSAAAERGADGTWDLVFESLAAPMPRAWQWLDGSAFKSHGDLMATVFGMEKLPYEVPLMYQGMSHQFLAAHDDVPMASEDDGIDFEGEFGIIVDRVPAGISSEQALQHIRLIVLINDWSLRVLAPIEMRTGFGWIQAKPACSMAPIAVTPDELDKAWADGRVHLPVRVSWNGAPFGRPQGSAMAFGFHNLVAHAARTRELCAGTIIGSGTVSNENYREVGSTCIAERRGIEMIDHGKASTPFMRFGDRVRMEANDSKGISVFGPIDQRVIRRS